MYRHGGLGVVYAFPETNPSAAIPNTTFSVDVPLEPIIRDAVSLSVPYVAAAAPAYVNAIWPYMEPKIQSMVDQNAAAAAQTAKQASARVAVGLATLVGAVVVWKLFSKKR